MNAVFASGIPATNGVADPATCDTGTLETSTGPAQLRAQFTPEVINLKWYNGNTRITVPTTSNTCTYDTAISLPTNPTKPGYKFKGWKVIQDYTPIEYLESTGTQWIDTDFSAPNGYRTQIGFSTSSNSYHYVMGSHGVSSPYGRNYLEIYYTTIEIGAGGYYSYSNEIQTNTKYDIEFSTIKDNVYLQDDTLRGSRDKEASRSTYKLYLFAVNRGNVPTGNFSGRIYYTKIWDDNGTLVRDFIPAKDLSGVACMYDKVSGQFFYNAGTGNFVAGPEI